MASCPERSEMNFTLQTDAIGLTALILLFALWIVFGVLLLLRKKPPQTEEAKRAPTARLGIALQGVAYELVWAFRRARWWPFPESVAGEVILAILSVALAGASNWPCLRSIQTLGKQWTVRARLIKEHELITSGPYSLVRNPIYLGMLGLMVGTGLVLSTWWSLLAAMVLLLVGNHIRAEEKLLREAFGSQIDDYARRVPAFLPWVY
jgi:protein-S-isoprenylcysteine O-methyltransferase Ste14